MSKTANGEHATTDRLSDCAHESVDKVAGPAGKAEEKIRQGAGDARNSANSAGKKAKEQSEETLHSITDFVGENPMISLGLAFAAGTLVSALRRKS